MRNISLSGRIGKKGLSMQMIAVLILMLLLLIGMLMFQQKFFQELPGYKSWARCKASVEANSLLRLKKFEFSPGVDCHTDSISIKSKRKANPTIAKAMTDCWNIFGRGKLNLFSDEGRYCFVCSIIDFENADFKEIPGLYDFMFNARMPRSAETYMDFLTNGKSKPLLEQIKSQGITLGNEVLPVKKYAVYFLYDKGDEFMKKDLSNILIPKFIIKSEKSPPPITGKVITGAAIIVPVLMVVALAGMAITEYVIPPDGVSWRSAIILGEYDSQKLQELECTQNLPKS